MSSSRDAELLRESFRDVTFFSLEVANRIYPKLFARAPETEVLFEGVSVQNQRRMLSAAFHYVVMNYEHRSALENLLRRLGARHQDYGTRPEHYGIFVECTLESLEETLGMEWSSELDRVWRDALGQVVDIMLEGYKADGMAHAKVK